MFFSRIQLYLFIGAAFILGVLGIYASGVQRGIARTQNRINEKRLDTVRTAKEVGNEIQSLDDAGLVDRANRWVRKPRD
jgi:hypothetical protein